MEAKAMTATRAHGKVNAEANTKRDFKLGRLMRAWREKNGLSQREVAAKLGYQNINFISMLEHGWSNIPFPRIQSVVKAYGFPAEMGVVMAMTIAPETWDTFLALNEKVIKSKALPKAAERCQEVYRELCSETNVR
jgi:transcriptional regulator with XRE-family HTH domain